MPGSFTISVNGADRAVVTDADRPLLDVLREELGLTGTKYGCGEGACGACTVILNGEAARSCITTIEEASGCEVETIEGLADRQQLHAVQQAFIDESAMQCGYCVPGQIMAAVALLRSAPQATRADVVAAMSGNLCRCCNYSRIRAAVEKASGAS
ncbi:Isoquinoline 1-oxidoreductase subunit alpha [Pirellulimonas nuda]|uniref:Isoquinoline 1-oxidoreductase subunit alpha n=1 Tax=Pirellulimonas nuda TaxID=2528009 RepID=A0A518DCV5_9BACT|nr:(2Fe-2S)-binding protein [Pirellulimonas nuda]QDU89299.1 Isoquinoline 1-oxidoreductase subunit alpha [Pirellulimonas nuda]